MRRLVMFLVVALLAVPMVSFAQDQKIGWNLQDGNYIDVQDLGFRFYYPTSWVFDLKSGKGISIADTQESLDAEIDDDDSTTPSGLTISIRGVPLDAITDLGDNPSLDKMVNSVIEMAQISETERAEVPVMSRRSISVFGTSTDGRAGVGTFWVQNGYLVVALFGGPDIDTINQLAYTWGVTLGNIKPLDAQDLGDAVLTDETSKFTINYPADWTPDPKQPVLVYESADDIGQKNFNDVQGSVFTFSDAALSDLQLKDDATLDDVVEKAKLAFDLDDSVTHEEFVLLGQPAVTITGQPTADSPGASRGIVMTIGLVEGRAILLILATPSQETIDDLMPTWIQMLRSVKSTAESS